MNELLKIFLSKSLTLIFADTFNFIYIRKSDKRDKKEENFLRNKSIIFSVWLQDKVKRALAQG